MTPPISYRLAFGTYAERVRNLLDEQRNGSEKEMFGGIAFMIDGKMCCGVMKDDLMVRVGAEGQAEQGVRRHAAGGDDSGRARTRPPA